MKVSKIILASLLGAVAISGAFADEFDGSRNRCKAKSDKIWVERTHDCIPQNPCENPNFDQYCNREFRNLQLADGEYIGLINYYADVNNIDCKAVPQNAKLIGQDYVICMGKDVLVFEFDDINDIVITKSKVENFFSDDLMHALCKIMGGTLEEKTDYVREPWLDCVKASEDRCKTASKYFDIGNPVDRMDVFRYGWARKDSCNIPVKVSSRWG